VEGPEGRRTATGQQADIGGNRGGFGPGLSKDRDRLRPEYGNRRIRAMNLPVGEQSDSAVVIRVRGVRMDQLVQTGENHHGLKQQENTQPKGRAGPFWLP